jgi:hypothetical protein
MKAYKTKTNKLSGTSHKEINKKAQVVYNEIKRKTKRRPYVRSVYFKKSKIFVGLFWSHLYDKVNRGDRDRRIKLFPCAIDLIQNTKIDPESRDNPNKSSEILHRFYGLSRDNEKFCVQIKEDKRTGEKFFVSVFPYDDK